MGCDDERWKGRGRYCRLVDGNQIFLFWSHQTESMVIGEWINPGWELQTRQEDSFDGDLEQLLDLSYHLEVPPIVFEDEVSNGRD